MKLETEQAMGSRSFPRWNCPVSFCLAFLFLIVTLPGFAQELTPEQKAARRASLFPPRPPNIIMVVADHLGYRELGCYGQTNILTPHIDRLAREGMTFTHCYAGSGLARPSRVSLLTGLHTGHTSIRGDVMRPLATADGVLTTLMKAAKYQVGVIGQWDLGGHDSSGSPHRMGADQWLGVIGHEQARDLYPEFLWRTSLINQITNHVFPLEGNFQDGNNRLAHDLFSLAATNYVRVSKYEPFFLYLPLTLPGQSRTGPASNAPPALVDEPYRERSWPEAARSRATLISRVDTLVGGLLSHLDRLGLSTNTAIFVTSSCGTGSAVARDDNPDFFASTGHLRSEADSLYEGNLRVPLVVRWPEKVQAGTTNHLLLSVADLLPTALEVAQIQPVEGRDGISFFPTLVGLTQTNRHASLYWEMHQGSTQQALKMGPWKLIRSGGETPLQLYHLGYDPSEKHNLSGQFAGELELLSTHLNSFHQPLQNP